MLLHLIEKTKAAPHPGATLNETVPGPVAGARLPGVLFACCRVSPDQSSMICPSPDWVAISPVIRRCMAHLCLSDDLIARRKPAKLIQVTQISCLSALSACSHALAQERRDCLEDRIGNSSWIESLPRASTMLLTPGRLASASISEREREGVSAA